jgi:NADH:ubiquinone oxidoreductase subunit F (NADH-binding)
VPLTDLVEDAEPALGVHPDVQPALLRPDLHRRETLADYERVGGYAAGPEGLELIDTLAAAGLRGRGGAAFPLSVKWRAVREGPAPRYVIANGAEREPLSRKDRYLLRRRPHLVLDGLQRAAAAVEADRAFLYVDDARGAAAAERALDELGPRARVPVELVRAAPAYVAGEETAAVQALNGNAAKPTAKPPRPFEHGVRGRPTLVQNVETLAHAAGIARSGLLPFAALGTAESRGTFLLTASGACRRPGLYELPFGVPLADAFEVLAKGFTSDPRGFVMGGFFGGLLGPGALGLPLDYEAVKAAGSGLGCGAVRAIGEDECAVAVAAEILAFFAQESSGQCGVCVNGTAAMRDAVARLATARCAPDDRQRLERWSATLPGRGACALLDGAALIVGSLLREYPSELDEHAKHGCDHCLQATDGMGHDERRT